MIREERKRLMPKHTRGRLEMGLKGRETDTCRDRQLDTQTDRDSWEVSECMSIYYMNGCEVTDVMWFLQ